MNSTLYNISSVGESSEASIVNGFQKGYSAGIDKVSGLIFLLLATYLVQFASYLIVDRLDDKYKVAYENIKVGFDVIRFFLALAMFFKFSLFL